MTPSAAKKLVCDYLIVGAGATSMAFIDTLLTELPDTKIVLIDRKSQVGGHWVDAYGFVQLHQPSLLYGVASKQLEGNWAKLMLWNRMLPWKHRASKYEILSYFDTFVKEREAAGQLEFYPNCEYDWESSSAAATTTTTTTTDAHNGLYSFSSVDGQDRYEVQVDVKFVNATAGECIIPSQNPLPFPVDDNVRVMTPNQIYDQSIDRKHRSDLARSTKCYVVLGAGKTAMDTVVYLQRTMRVDPDKIVWVIPNDVWMLNRDGKGSPWVWPEALLEHNLDANKAALALEKEGTFFRLDPDVLPSQFRFPVVDVSELKVMRKVKTIIRRGRAKEIRGQRENGTDKVVVEFGDDKPGWEVPVATTSETVVVHCASPGPFNNKQVDGIFQSDKTLALNLLVAPPISMSMSNTAALEAARRKGTLDLDFGRQLLAALEEDSAGASCPKESNLADKYSENDVLETLIRGYRYWKKDPKDLAPLDPIFTLACFFAILDTDPMVAYDWQKSNRLQFLSIPGFKINIYEDITRLRDRAKELGYTEEKIRVFNMLADKLKPLEGM